MNNPDFLSTILTNFDQQPVDCRVLDLSDKTLTRDFFQSEILNSKTPVLIKNGVPETTRKLWSPENLRRYLESREENLWITRGVADQGDSQFEEISIRDYVNYLFDSDGQKEEREPMYISISKEFMEILPDMVKEFELDRFLPASYKKYPYAFLGPAGTVSGLHLDEYHSLFTQIWGDKVFLLFRPSDASNVYVSKKYDWASKLSCVDLRKVEHNRDHFPLVRRTRPFLARVVDGDCLWVPSGWFHFVYAYRPSFSVTFFLSNFWRSITYGVWEDWVKVFLHQFGIYGRKNGCTCHGTLVPFSDQS